MNEMNTTIQDKPVVYYIGAAQFCQWGEHQVARLQYVIGHPTLGDVFDVRTSTVLKVYPDGIIITRNTVYKPFELEAMGS
jgi:hypothetical protein